MTETEILAAVEDLWKAIFALRRETERLVSENIELKELVDSMIDQLADLP